MFFQNCVNQFNQDFFVWILLHLLGRELGQLGDITNVTTQRLCPLTSNPTPKLVTGDHRKITDQLNIESGGQLVPTYSVGPGQGRDNKENKDAKDEHTQI